MGFFGSSSKSSSVVQTLTVSSQDSSDALSPQQNVLGSGNTLSSKISAAVSGDNALAIQSDSAKDIIGAVGGGSIFSVGEKGYLSLTFGDDSKTNLGGGTNAAVDGTNDAAGVLDSIAKIQTPIPWQKYAIYGALGVGAFLLYRKFGK